MSRGDIILRLVDVTRIYKTKEDVKIVALNKVTTSFKRGEFVSIVGKSGSGKSTLINILGGLDKPDSGDYFLEGNNIVNLNEGHWDAIRNEKIGFIFQEYHLIEYLSVYKNVEIALKYQKYLNKSTKDAKIRDILTKVGLFDHMFKNPSQLSGGQRQRVAIARALVKDPDIILADEPTGALDHKTSETVIELIKGLSKERLVLVVTHDKEIANNHATRIIEISEGEFTNDLIKEDIEQTYQNVYKKTNPTNLSVKDKLELTTRKIKSQIMRTVFTALSLALAFSFTILFNGIERGFSDSYDNYYDALNMSNSYAFSIVPKLDEINIDNFNDMSVKMQDSFDFAFSEKSPEVVTAFSTDVAKRSNALQKVYDSNLYPDLLSDTKLRILDLENSMDKYNFDSLFVGKSYYSIGKNELMVTSKFFREYFNISDDVTTLSSYLETNPKIDLYNYYMSLDDGLFELDSFLNLLGENVETKELVFHNGVYPEDGSIVPIRYLKINIPLYCNNYDNIDSHYQSVCEDIIDDKQYSRYFSSIDDYIAYVDDFKKQIDKINDETIDFDLLLRSGYIYYFIDENEDEITEVRYIEKIFRKVIEDINSEDSTVFYNENVIYRSPSDTKEMLITAIIENDNESIIYMDKEVYNDLFETSSEIVNVEGYYTVNLLSEIKKDFTPEDMAWDYFAYPLSDLNKSYADDFKIVRKEIVEIDDQCSIYELDNVVNQNPDIDRLDILGDVFVVSDYSDCKVNTEAYHYLQSIKVLFGIFFNVLMIISIVFFNILLQVILSERIGEIGIYRSVGSTSKDIKVLFFYEVLFVIVLATIMSFLIIVSVDSAINNVFLGVVDINSRIINFANLTLSIKGQTITRISIFNLAFYISMVLLILGYLSNKNVSKIANTKPIDILRKVE